MLLKRRNMNRRGGGIQIEEERREAAYRKRKQMNRWEKGAKKRGPTSKTMGPRLLSSYRRCLIRY